MRRSEVSAVELRRQLSALLDTAWREPLLVTRYGMPWVWVLSDATWRQYRHYLTFAQSEHPLVRIRAHVDALLAQEDALLQRLHRAGSMAATPAALFRMVILEAIYAFGGTALLHEQVFYNRLYNWFTGVNLLSADDWTAAQLADSLRSLLDDAGAVDLIDRMLRDLPVDGLVPGSGGAVERDQLRGWKARMAW